MSTAGFNFGAFIPSTGQLIANQLAAMGFGTTGNIYYVDGLNGLDGNNAQSPTQVQGQAGQGPVKTLAAGYAFLREGRNDVLVVIGNGLASGSVRLTAGFTWSKNAAHMVGICSGSWISQRARI